MVKSPRLNPAICPSAQMLQLPRPLLGQPHTLALSKNWDLAIRKEHQPSTHWEIYSMIREAHLTGISRYFTDCWIIKIIVCSFQPIVFLHQWRHIQKPSVASSTSSRYPQEHRIQMVCFTHHFVGFLAGTNSGPAWFMLTPSWWVWNHLLGMEEKIESAVDGRNWSGFGWFCTKMMINIDWPSTKHTWWKQLQNLRLRWWSEWWSCWNSATATAVEFRQ